MTNKTEIHVHIRPMTASDINELLDVEKQCFEFPWTERDFISCLRQRNCIGMVAEYDDRVVGFMVYESHNDHLYVLNLAVDPLFQRRGIGMQMAAKLATELSYTHCNRITLAVRETNLVGQLFFREMGFHAIHIARDFYFDSAEDAYLMEYPYKSSKYEANDNVGQPPAHQVQLATEGA